VNGCERRQFDSAEQLDAYLHQLNENGLDPVVPLLSGNGRVYLTYGEERSGGGEYMRCWLVDGDPYSRDFPYKDYCDECGQPVFDESMALDDRLVRYPMTLLHDPLTAV
jgi:hypothetical protein